MSLLRDFTDKPIKANPVFVLALGLCPTLAVTTNVRNGVAMAAAWVADVYLRRWKCEETYRFPKQAYRLEDGRVRVRY